MRSLTLTATLKLEVQSKLSGPVTFLQSDMSPRKVLEKKLTEAYSPVLCHMSQR